MATKLLEQYRLPQLPPLDQVGPQIPAQTKLLEGRQFDLTLDGGGAFSLALKEGRGSFRTSVSGWPAQGEGAAEVCAPRDGLFLISLDVEEPAVDAFTVALLMNEGRAVIVRTHYIGDDAAQFDRGPNGAQEFRCASIDGESPAGEVPAVTKDLLGGRDFLVFDNKNIREFIYLNKTRLLEHYVYTEVLNGKAERHHATYMKLSDQLYLIGWREMDTSIAYVGLFDYAASRMTGTLFHMTTPWAATAGLTGAMLVPVNGRIEYLDGLEPTN